jgi:hypothetical protein
MVGQKRILTTSGSVEAAKRRCGIPAADANLFHTLAPCRVQALRFQKGSEKA